MISKKEKKDYFSPNSELFLLQINCYLFFPGISI